MATHCKRYSPLVSVDEPSGILIDTTGCEGLFGGERALLQRVHQDFSHRGISVQVALAPTPLCARAMARFKPFAIIAPKDLPHALYQLPLEALELDLRTQQTLHELGIKRLLEFFRLPRAQLLSRFGIDILHKIDAFRGEKSDPRVFEAEVRDWVIEEAVCDTIRDSEHLCVAIFDILKRLCGALSQEGLGLLKLEIILKHLGKRESQISAGVVQPSCNADKIFRLLKYKLDNLNAGLGVEHIVMRAKQTKRLLPQEKTLAYESLPPDTDVSTLIDTLFNRIGAKNVFKIVNRESHIPEKACETMSMFSEGRRKIQDDVSLNHKRPTRLLKIPEPIDVIAMMPDSPPRRIRWRRGFVFDVIKADGPERIESEWWNESEQETRDYYCVENASGLRLWVFKQMRPAETSWYLHGLMG